MMKTTAPSRIKYQSQSSIIAPAVMLSAQFEASYPGQPHRQLESSKNQGDLRWTFKDIVFIINLSNLVITKQNQISD